MSELRIRSEAVSEALWPQAFLPPQARIDDDLDSGDESDFGPLVSAAARALTRLFGVPVDVVPGLKPRPQGGEPRPQGGEPRPQGGEPAPRVALVLAAVLATLQLGGDVGRGVLPGTASGLTLARQARAIAAALDGVADRFWPEGCRLAGCDLDVSCGAIAGHVHVAAPASAMVAPPAAEPVAALATRVFDMPMRIRIELATRMAMVASLLPLRAGTVLPIDPLPEMPIILGDHRIGHVTLTSLPDGRQQATIVAIRVESLGGVS